MKRFIPLLALVVLGTLLAATTSEAPQDLQAFAALDPIDAHVHAFTPDPAFVGLLKTLRLHVLDIVVVNDKDKFEQGLESRVRFALAMVHSGEGRVLLCTSFDPFKFEEPNFAAAAIKQMDQDFAAGAIAVKIWKNFGMEIKNRQGKFVLPDDPALQPIYQDIAAHDKTLIAHLAEPDAAWQPIGDSPDFAYVRNHPEWHMYGHSDAPSKAAILAARDHILAENPKLRMVGAHLGSMEADVDEIAQRFDRYPNFAVDTAARVRFLMAQPREKVRAFLIKYQDRILYGTDLDIFPSENAAEAIHKWQTTYAREWKYFATDEMLDYRDHKVQGLKLPDSVLRKLYHDNAVRWIPGSDGAK